MAQQSMEVLRRRLAEVAMSPFLPCIVTDFAKDAVTILQDHENRIAALEGIARGNDIVL